MPTVDELIVKLKAENTELRNKLKQSKGDLNEFGDMAIKVGGLLASLFAVKEMAEFALEASKAAGAAEGVSSAFENLNGINLSDLREAVDNTVDDLTLMKAAVRAENFKIPLEKLGTFFEFATKRATQTGESVDYLVDSIINGIGRKSSLVLDNLGISASELQEEIRKVGDFGVAAGNIVERELKKMGDVAETTGAKYDRIVASWNNLTIAVGNFINKSPLVQDALDKIAGSLQGIAEFLDPEAAKWEEYRRQAQETGEALKGLTSQDLDSYIDLVRKRMKDAQVQFSSASGRLRELTGEFFKDQIAIAAATDTMNKARDEANQYSAILSELLRIKEKGNEVDKTSLALTEEEVSALEALTEKYAILLKVMADANETADKMKGAEVAAIFPDLGDIDINDVDALEKELEEFFKTYEEGGEAVNVSSFQWEAGLLRTQEAMKQFNQQMRQLVAQFATEILVDFATTMGEIIAVGDEAADGTFGQRALRTIGEFMKTLGQLMIAFGVNLALFENAVESLNPYVAIAAGIALVAAGAAISAYASKGIAASAASTSANANASNTSSIITGINPSQQNIIGEVRLSGEDIIIALRNSNANSNAGGLNYGYSTGG